MSTWRYKNKNKIRKQKERECGAKKGASAKIEDPMAFPSHYQECEEVIGMFDQIKKSKAQSRGLKGVEST